MSEERFWNTDEYASTAKFTVSEVAMTMRRAGRIFRLDPAPPKVEDINDYIVAAVRENDLTHFIYFLHHYEPRLNKRVYRFLLNEGIDRYDPLRFLDYKLSVVLALLECLPNYNPDKGADFLTYAHYFIGNALLDCRRQEEAGPFKSLDEYKAARGIAWLYNNSGKSAKEVIAEYAAEQNCTEETATEYLTLARQNRSRVPFYVTMQDEDSEETGEDVTRDDSWNYADILWNGIRADAVQAAFEKLSHKEKFFLEKRTVGFCLCKFLVFCSLQPTKSACSAVAEKCLSGAGQPLSSVSGRERYNTLDFASKIVCQQGCYSPLWTPAHFPRKWYPNCKNAGCHLFSENTKPLYSPSLRG